jgi:hypothetical protein
LATDCGCGSSLVSSPFVLSSIGVAQPVIRVDQYRVAHLRQPWATSAGIPPLRLRSCLTEAWRSALDACRLRFLEIRGRFCLSSRLIDWEGFLRKQRVLSIQDSLQLCSAGTPFVSIAHALQGADPAHFGYCSRRQYGLLFLQPAMRALMGRTIIAAVGTIANWAIYSSPSLPRITRERDETVLPIRTSQNARRF